MRNQMRCRSASIAALVLGLSVFPSGAGAQTRAVLTPEDVLAVQSFAGGQPIAVSSTGRWIAYVVTDKNEDWNVQEPRPTGHVFVQTLGDKPSAPRALTSGAAHSAFPVWSPDGTRLAFVREEQGRGREIVWDAARDQATPVGDAFAARMYVEPQWDPTGKTLVVAAAEPEAAPAPYRVRSVKSTDARIPGDQFFTDERKATLVAIDVASGKSTPLSTSHDHVAVVQALARRDAPFVHCSGSRDARRDWQGTERHVRAAGRSRGRARKPLRPANWAIAGATGGRRMASSCLATRGGKLMVQPAEGGEAKAWRDSLTITGGEPVWSPDGTRFATLVADPSISDPELEKVKPGMYTTARPFNDVYLVANDGSSKNLTKEFEDQVADLVWSRDGSALYFRATNNKTYDETLYRYSVADQKLDTVLHGSESYDRIIPTAGGLVVSIEDATHPTDIWMIGTADKRTRVTDLNPQLATFTFSKPEIFYYDNADGERLGALLYKPAGLGPNEKVPVITWVYEKMTPAVASLQRARSDVHHARLRDADAEREDQGRRAGRFLREMRRSGSERGPRHGLHHRQVRHLGAQLRRVRDVESDHTDEHLRRSRIRRDTGRVEPQLGERPRSRFAQYRDRAGPDRREPFRISGALPVAVRVLSPERGQYARLNPARREGPDDSLSARARCCSTHSVSWGRRRSSSRTPTAITAFRAIRRLTRST